MKTFSSDVEEINTVTFQKTFHGASYPLSKPEIIELAELNYADEDMIDALSELGDSNYFSLSDIQQEIKYLFSDKPMSENNRFYLYYRFDIDTEEDDEESDY